MTTLSPGANAPVESGQLTVTVSYSPIPGADIDVSAFLLDAAGKVRGDTDMCFYGQPSVNGGLLQMTDASAGRAIFTLDLGRIEAAVEKVALTATIHENKARFGSVSNLSVSISGGLDAPIATSGMQETALILGEFYRRQGAWKFRCVAQGFAGGLEPLAKHFGVDVAAPAAPSPAPVQAPPPPAPTPTPAPAKINLSKITLDKSRSTISLEKSSGDFGEIRINLNWNQKSSGGLLSFGKPKAIDLDLGCMYEMQNGERSVIQALGKRFGQYDAWPYVQLMGDDRTGSVSDGEWLRINGKHWKEIKRILIFTYIYKGAPNWKETDGVVTLYAPDQPPIEVRLSEEGGRQGMCGIALLENDAGAVKVIRRVDFHNGHEDLDKAYGWGMRWKAGSK